MKFQRLARSQCHFGDFGAGAGRAGENFNLIQPTGANRDGAGFIKTSRGMGAANRAARRRQSRRKRHALRIIHRNHRRQIAAARPIHILIADIIRIGIKTRGVQFQKAISSDRLCAQFNAVAGRAFDNFDESQWPRSNSYAAAQTVQRRDMIGLNLADANFACR
ncbi:MAG: hypothetical protein ALAOOOJD_01029 [bacterium]|nr:hypothetical protein [bacterium]